MMVKKDMQGLNIVVRIILATWIPSKVPGGNFRNIWSTCGKPPL
jgi:hypothetical protein